MKMIHPSSNVPPQLAPASIELSLAQIVIVFFDRAASERASWKLECRSFAVLDTRLFAVNELMLGTPIVKMMPMISIVISIS